jgi:hypothetical protein
LTAGGAPAEMAQTTEAACLLQTGAQYTRRLGLRSTSGDVTFAGLKRGAFSLYFGDEPYFHTDLEGRWQRAFIAGVHYRKALDGTIDAIDRVREGANLVLRRRSPSFAEAADLDAAIRGMALDLIERVDAGRLDLLAPPAGVAAIAAEELRDLVERVARWDAAAWFAHRERYVATYGPLPFLPPDCHQSVVLQATLGDAGGRAFGGGPAAEHHVRAAPEFQEHAQRVAALWGRRVLQAKSLFVGGGDFLRRPAAEAAAYLEAAARVFPLVADAAPRRLRDLPEDIPHLDGLDAFLDDFAPPLPDRDGWRRLAGAHLRRVNLGVESGEPEIRGLYGKTWSEHDLRAAVADMKEAGIGVRVVALVGAGGVAMAERHAMATAELVDSLALGLGDLVYLVDTREVGDASLGGRVEPLDDPGVQAQQAWLKERLARSRAERGFKVAPYSLEKQWN